MPTLLFLLMFVGLLPSPPAAPPNTAPAALTAPPSSPQAIAATAAQPLPLVIITGETTIESSAIIRINPDQSLDDTAGRGVIRIAADDITIEFEGGSVLRGATEDLEEAPPNTFTGYGIRIEGHRNITIRNAQISGYKVGILADNAPGLLIDGGNISGNFRQHLRSTPTFEAPTDSLKPQENENGEWITNYGAAIAIHNSEAVTIRNVTVRRGQNGIILDRVSGSKIYDNDASFLSGWGLAMWRSSENLISRNAFDFCIRGYSKGVYESGHSSAGILMAGPCRDNTIIENSATHGGHGLLALASPPDSLGGGNMIVDNDFSYAANAADVADPAIDDAREVPEAIGNQRPVGARKSLAGTENIIMTEWGPWDHEDPHIRTLSNRGRYHMYEFLNMDGNFVRVFVNDLVSERARMPESQGRWATTIAGPWAGLFPYKIIVDNPDYKRIIAGALLNAKWNVTFFPWTAAAESPQPSHTPPADLDAWRTLADGPNAVRIEHDQANFYFGDDGPSQLNLSAMLRDAAFDPDFFGLTATTSVPLAAGEYRIRTRSKGGIRVQVNGQEVVKNWTHEGLTHHEVKFKVETDSAVELSIDFFKSTGVALLEFELEPTLLDAIRQQEITAP